MESKQVNTATAMESKKDVDEDEDLEEESEEIKKPADDGPTESFDLIDQIANLVNKPQLADVTFLVGPEKKAIRGHRLMFAARSVVFESMLYPAFPELQPVQLPLLVELSDVKPEAFETCVKFLYSDKVDWDPVVLKHCVELSERYQVDGLRAACATFMEGGLNPDNACTLMESMPAMANKALKYIENETDDVVKSRDWLSLSPSNLLRIVKDEKLSVREVELFKGVIEWGKEQVKRQPGKNLKSLVQEYMPFIRFPTMTSQEIATDVSLTGVLEASQLLEVFTFLGRVASGESDITTPCSFPTQPRFGSQPKICNFNWAEEDKTNDLVLQSTKKAVFSGSCRTNVFVRGNEPLPASRMSYFAIRLDQSPGCYTAFGVVTPTFNKTLRLGEDEYSWAIRLYPNNGTDLTFTGAIHRGNNVLFHNQWAVNDLVGLLIDSKEGSMTVYKNGAVIGKPFTNIKTKEKLFCAMNLCHSTSVTLTEPKTAKRKGKGVWEFS